MYANDGYISDYGWAVSTWFLLLNYRQKFYNFYASLCFYYFADSSLKELPMQVHVSALTVQQCAQQDSLGVGER